MFLLYNLVSLHSVKNPSEVEKLFFKEAALQITAEGKKCLKNRKLYKPVTITDFHLEYAATNDYPFCFPSLIKIKAKTL